MTKSFLALLGVWTHFQTSLTKVFRWGNHRARNQALRGQTNLEHTYAFMFLAMTALPKLQWHFPKLDNELILSCIHLHDIGEGEIGHDTPFINKRQEIDVQEFLGFRRRIQDLDDDVRERLEAAFLLQFCLGDNHLFPDDARVVMNALKEKYSHEALIFAALERLDYIKYASESFVVHGDEVILTHVLRKQIDEMAHYAKKIPGFDEIWTPEMHTWATDFLTNHANVPEEKRAA